MSTNAKICAHAAEALRSSERWLKWQYDLCESTPEIDGKYHDPEWEVRLDHVETERLVENLRRAAEIFERLADGGAE